MLVMIAKVMKVVMTARIKRLTVRMMIEMIMIVTEG